MPFLYFWPIKSKRTPTGDRLEFQNLRLPSLPLRIPALLCSGDGAKTGDGKRGDQEAVDAKVDQEATAGKITKRRLRQSRNV
jgi:hypothetical protein